ncbi:MAG TPA: YtxH domain-containing protein [Bacteroidia bacterium]|nr:YtxH domain-containing protein [Bacteroidia bacterium]
MKSQNKHLLVALLCGAAAGAALGVLFAPASGSELRKTMAEDALGIKGKFSDKLKDVVDLVQQVSESLRSKTT